MTVRPQLLRAVRNGWRARLPLSFPGLLQIDAHMDRRRIPSLDDGHNSIVDEWTGPFSRDGHLC